MTPETIIEYGAEIIEKEAQGLLSLSKSLGRNFSETVNTLVNCNGRVIVTGIGKSGHIARKIASTFASTGTPASFIHPAEASHGDLGMIETRDVVIALSKSGESMELSDTLAYCRRFGIPIIGITANPSASLAQLASQLLLIPEIEEACPLGLAPTTSTTMILALGDALAGACLRARNFQASQFKVFHPGGKLGQKLSRVRDVMHGIDELPLVPQTARLTEAVVEMSRGRFGCVGVLNADRRLTGIFTDGDLRRHFQTATDLSHPIASLMHPSPEQISPEALVADVAHLFTARRIPSVFACVDDKPVGIVHVHDLLQKGFI
jgi:arabinose-5-phosphate isomerase